MSTISGLMLRHPDFQPFDLGRTLTQATNIQGGQLANQTSLLQLEEMRRAQEEAAQARQFMAANAGQMVPGGGGGPLLASPALTAGAGPMTQQTIVPGQPPGAPQPVPGGQDLSRFAAGGGMPSGPPQSTLGGLQPQQDPLQALMARSPGAALQVMQTQMKIQEQQLTMREKVAGALGQIFQGVTDQASYDEARAQVQQFNPRLAAQLPSVYNKDLVQRLVKQAVDVKSSATLAIQNMQAQAEIGKYNLQLQNAGYQGLGTAVTDVLKGFSEEEVAKFGGRTSAAAIKRATEIVQEKEIARREAEQRFKFTEEQKQQASLPLQDARKEDAGLFVYGGTGKTVPGTLPYGQVKTLQDEKDPDKRVVRLANLDEKKQLTNLKQLEPVLQQYSELIQYAYGPGGPMENYTRSPQGVVGAAFRQAFQTDPKLEGMRRSLMGQLQSLVRGLGARGDLNEQELKAATEMLANFDASGGLGLSFGPVLTTGGPGISANIKPSLSIPDTPQVGLELANNLIDTVNKRIGSLVQHEGYAKTPQIKLGETKVPPRTWGEAQEVTPGQAQPVQPQPAPTSAAPGVPPRTWGEMQPVTPGQPTPPAPGQGTPPALPEVPASRPGTPPGRQSAVQRPGWPKVASVQDVAEAMRQTGRSRREVEEAMRAKGFRVYGSTLPLPEVTMVG